MVAISAMEQRRLENEKIIPIRKAVLGRWKIVECHNWEGVGPGDWSFELFSENLKFEMVDGKLKQSGGGKFESIEGDYPHGTKKLYVEDNHLKTIWSGGSTEDIYIQNGRLHYVQTFGGEVWKRIYKQRSWDAEDCLALTALVVSLIGAICVVSTIIYAIVRLIMDNPVPIKEDIKGSWKMVDHINFEGYQKANSNLNLNFETFSENLTFDTLPDKRLVQTGGGSPQLIEDSTRKMILYEEDNHLKTDYSTEDRFIEDGKLIRIDFFEGGVTKRVYERI